MSANKEKRCPRCDMAFTCCVGSIALCQCSTVQLDAAQRRHIAERYNDCLCAQCLVEECNAFSNALSTGR